MAAGCNLIKEKVQENRKFMRAAYGLAALFCCYLTLQPLSGEISGGIRFLCYFCCIFSSVKMSSARNRTRSVFDKPWKKILQIALEVYGTFAIVGMYFLYGGITCEIRYPGLLYFVFALFWIHPVMQGFLALLIKMGDTVSIVEHTVRLRARLLLIGMVLLPCLLFLAAFNPAITTQDSYDCLQAVQHLWQSDALITDWHPPFYLFVLHLLLQIFDSITFLIIVQCTYFAVVFVDGILFLYQCGFSEKILGLFYAFITLGISNIIQLVSLYKDAPYMISLMWLTVLLMKFTMQHEKYQEKKGWYLQFIAAAVLTAFFRQNGILPALAVIILLPFITKFTPKIIGTSIVCMLLMITVKGPLYRSMNVVPQPQLKFFAMANDIMYSYYIGDKDVSDDAMTMINAITGDDPDNFVADFTYSPYWVFYNGGEPRDYSVTAFVKMYVKNFLRHPKMAVMPVLTRNSVIWSIVKPAGEHAGDICVLTDYHEQIPDLYPHRTDTIFTPVLTRLCYWFTNRKILYPFYWRTGIYNLLIICMSVTALCFQQKRKLMHFIPYVPILGNLAALAISSGWSDYRYFWPSMTISLFLLFYFLFNRKVK